MSTKLIFDVLLLATATAACGALATIIVVRGVIRPETPNTPRLRREGWKVGARGTLLTTVAADLIVVGQSPELRVVAGVPVATGAVLVAVGQLLLVGAVTSVAHDIVRLTPSARAAAAWQVVEVGRYEHALATNAATHGWSAWSIRWRHRVLVAYCAANLRARAQVRLSVGLGLVAIACWSLREAPVADVWFGVGVAASGLSLAVTAVRLSGDEPHERMP